LVVQDIHEGLNFASDSRGDAFGLWSLQFSEDGRELVAGSNDKRIYVYDLEANKPVLKINAHKVWFHFTKLSLIFHR
jgi:WD repeat-containing protein 23